MPKLACDESPKNDAAIGSGFCRRDEDLVRQWHLGKPYMMNRTIEQSRERAIPASSCAVIHVLHDVKQPGSPKSGLSPSICLANVTS